MENPWLNIPKSDYVNHMIEIGQAQMLSDMTSYCLNKYNPEVFVLLGCSTGNGLEHVNSKVTKTVYAVDINADFLQSLIDSYNRKINNLRTCACDIQNSDTGIIDADLVFMGLLLEYVNPEQALTKVVKMLKSGGILFIVIQKDKGASFVSKTQYKSLETLAGFSNKVNDDEIKEILNNYGFELIEKKEIELTKEKSFICLEYKKGNDK